MDDATILALGSHDGVAFELAQRAARLGFRVVSAKTPDDAIALRARRGFQFTAAMLDTNIGVAGSNSSLDALRNALESPDLVYVAAGDPPGESLRTRLREAGVELALWHPCSDNALRFQLNQSLARVHPSVKREQRAPTAWRARVFKSGRQKLAQVYSLSGGGAFLTTHQPSMTGSDLAVELPMPRGPETFRARVLYTNVPGNLRAQNLPDGMAVRWRGAQLEKVEAIRAVVSDYADALRV